MGICVPIIKVGMVGIRIILLRCGWRIRIAMCLRRRVKLSHIISIPILSLLRLHRCRVGIAVVILRMAISMLFLAASVPMVAMICALFTAGSASPPARSGLVIPISTVAILLRAPPLVECGFAITQNLESLIIIRQMLGSIRRFHFPLNIMHQFPQLISGGAKEIEGVFFRSGRAGVRGDAGGGGVVSGTAGLGLGVRAGEVAGFGVGGAVGVVGGAVRVVAG